MAGMVENWVAGFRTIDDGRTSVANYIWDTGGLAWIPQTGSGIGPATDVNVTNSSLAVTGPLTDAQLRSAPVEVSITDPAGVPLNTIVDTFHGGSILAVGLESLEDQHGFKGAFDPASQLQIAEPYRLVGTAFGAALDANFWAVANGGGAGAAAGVANSIATIASGTAGATGWAQISTLRSARFLFVHPLRFRAGIRLPTLAVSNCDTRGWGPTQLSSGLPQEGPFFKVDAAGLLHCCIVKAGVVTHDVVSGNFNGAVPGVTLNTNAHAFEVVYFTMGV